MDLSSIFWSSPLQTSSNVTIRPTKWSKDGCIGLGADNREPQEWWENPTIRGEVARKLRCIYKSNLGKIYEA